MTEFELKLQIPSHRTQAVTAAVRRGRTERRRLQARYFDTHDRALAAHGIVVRLRREGRRWVQTAKAASGAALERLEHNVALGARSAPAPDLALHDETPLGELIRHAIKLEPGEPFPPLELVYETDIVRLARTVRKGPSTIEIALDTGRVLTADRSAAVSELELELKKGRTADAVELARSWCLAHGLWLSAISKSMRGQRLAAGEEFGVAVTARTPSFERDACGRELAVAIVSSCLDQILPNASDIAAGCTAAEHIHQLRVGLRRLRTALRELAQWMPALEDTLHEALVSVFRDLGRHRDRSHLVDTVQRQIEAAGGPPLDWTALPAPLPNVVASVRLLAFQKALLGLIAFVHDDARDPAPQDATQKPAPRKSVIKRVHKLHRALVAGGRQFLALDEAAQHRLRKQVKRLRYVVEFTEPLWHARKAQAYVSALKPVQDALGSYNDELTALRAWQELAAHDPRAWFGVGWLAARRPANAQACVRACATFAEQAEPEQL